MSVQFGRWSFCGAPADPGYIAKVREMLSPYGPDGGKSYSSGGVDLLYFAFHTTKESRLETQPHVSRSGAVVTWDGRLDNRVELAGLLDRPVATDFPDVSIVAAAYERWGTDCFAKLIGDWALSIWNPSQRSLVLAKDPIGTRHLYYSAERDHVTWSTILDPLVLLAGKAFELDEEYIAGWLSAFPATHLTPCVGIHAVSPSSFVTVKAKSSEARKYWDLDPGKQVRYRTDTEYEEHFRTVFAESVRRRLRSDAPVLAELSGGMDSSSIVCTADRIIASGAADTPRLDTVSYYNDSEPDWNERPYFTKVEQMRGRAGCHIAVSSEGYFDFEDDPHTFAATPGSLGRATESDLRFAAYTTSHGNRVLLSGIGGDEVTGGVPTPVPELADLLARAKFRTLARQLKAWALAKRRPWFQLVAESLRPFLPASSMRVPGNRRPPLWLDRTFANRHRLVLTGYERRWSLLPLPSFQEKLSTLEALQRQMSCYAPLCRPLIERRYPYLDRDFLEFLGAVPPQQLVRPGVRRSLLRRALAGIVPDEILNRKRKAYVARGPGAALSANWHEIAEMSQDMRSSALGIIEAKAFVNALNAMRTGQTTTIVPLLRALAVERWLRNFARWGPTGPSMFPGQELGRTADTVRPARSAEVSLS